MWTRSVFASSDIKLPAHLINLVNVVSSGFEHVIRILNINSCVNKVVKGDKIVWDDLEAVSVVIPTAEQKPTERKDVNITNYEVQKDIEDLISISNNFYE